MLRSATTALAAAALALVGGCGEDEDDGERAATYRVAVSQATFPARQQLAEHVELRIAVRNTGTRTIPNLAVTLATVTGSGEDTADAFSSNSGMSGLSSRARPVWIVDEGPRSGDTAYANTWALGPLAPKRTRSFTWRVVPVRAGRYELRYRLVGSTSGRSRLRLSNGSTPAGTLRVRVSGRPAKVRVTPGGRIVSVPG